MVLRVAKDMSDQLNVCDSEVLGNVQAQSREGVDVSAHCCFWEQSIAHYTLDLSSKSMDPFFSLVYRGFTRGFTLEREVKTAAAAKSSARPKLGVVTTKGSRFDASERAC